MRKRKGDLGVAVLEPEKPSNRMRFKPLKTTVLFGVLICIVLFLRASVLRVEVETRVPSGSFPVTTFGFIVLFVGGVFYGLWMLVIEHYIAASMIRQLLARVGKATQEGFDERNYAL